MRAVSLLAAGLWCAVVSGAHNRDVGGPFGSTIHQVPKLMPTDSYKKHMREQGGSATDGEYAKLQAKYEKLKAEKEVEGKSSAPAKAEVKEQSSKASGGDHAGTLFTVGMFGAVVLIAVVFAMASTQNKTVRCYTWASLDNVAAVFLAVLFFQAFDSLMDDFDFPKHHKVIAAAIHAAVLLLLAFVISWRMRENKVNLAIFCAAGAHYVSFGSMHAAILFVNHHWSSTIEEVVMGVLLIILVLGAVFLAAEFGRRAAGLVDDEWQDKIDDLQNDFGAMAAAVCFSLLVRACISGEYHHISDDEETEDAHTATERRHMLIYACVLIPVAGFLVQQMSSMQARLEAQGRLSYWTKRTIMFFTAFLCMSVAWAFLLWGEWEFDGRDGGPVIQNKVHFALAATVVCCLSILALGQISGGAFRSARKVTLTALSLLVGWSWEESFDAAVESVTEDSKNPGTMKIMLALGLACVILPVYVTYLKPVAMDYEEQLEKLDEDEDKGKPA